MKLQPETVMQTGNYYSTEYVCGVVFGTPSRHCTGSGVCMVTSLQILKRRQYACRYVKAYLGRGHRGEITLRVPFDSFPEEHIARVLNKGIFQVEETFQIPPWLTGAWGGHRIYIPPGKYSTVVLADAWLIRFTDSFKTLIRQ